LADLLEREAKQQRTVDPAVLQKREELAVAREKLFLELSDRIQNNRLLDHTLTAAEMRDVLSPRKNKTHRRMCTARRDESKASGDAPTHMSGATCIRKRLNRRRSDVPSPRSDRRR
jgi:hypothetical protein